MSDTLYWHAVCKGMYVNLKTTGDHKTDVSKLTELALTCPLCLQDHEFKRVSEDEWRRLEGELIHNDDYRTGATTVEVVGVSPVEPAFKFNPQIKDTGPGGPLEVTVDLPDNPTDQEMFEAMEEAAREAGLA